MLQDLPQTQLIVGLDSMIEVVKGYMFGLTGVIACIETGDLVNLITKKMKIVYTFLIT